MNEWFTNAATTPQQRWPSEIFVRWVNDNYGRGKSGYERAKIIFMELGSGSGADLRMLETEGFVAVGIDAAPEAYANWHEDVSYIGAFKEFFDCIYSLNVLCHIENPPYYEIAEALKPGGKFFAIMPASDTEADLEGKGFTRLSTPFSIRTELDNIFSKIDIRPSCYPHRQRNHINWVVEADK